MAFVTSLASRRSVQVGGEHLHRLFAIPVINLPATELAQKALSRLDNDMKRRYFLEKLQLLVIEEVSLIHAELWATIDLILQMVKENDLPFGGVLIIANGDCCQLPSVTGTDIFQSSRLLFNFNFHFLLELVRMRDEKGQEVLRLLEQRPVPNAAIERICLLLSESCNFHSSWNNMELDNIMKVFGKRSAERKALEDHSTRIRQSGQPFFISNANDEMCLNKSQMWRPADTSATKNLNKTSREPENLLLYPKAVLRLTRNMESSSQGDLFILDFDNSNDDLLTLYKAPNPHSITKECLDNDLFSVWSTVNVHKTSGFVFSTTDGSLRRKQFPFCNYIALTVHKLMGDTFHCLATSISAHESMYSLWLTSQIYVIISRVRTLASLHFVGNKDQTLDAIKNVLGTTHLHEESVYTFINYLKQQQQSRVRITNVPCTMYLRHHFEIPSTENGFVFLLVSLADRTFSTFHIDESEGSLSDKLRQCNSTHDSSMLDKQPWAMGFFIWHFPSRTVRTQCLLDIRRVVYASVCNFEFVCDAVKVFIASKYVNLSMCVTGQIINDVNEI